MRDIGCTESSAICHPCGVARSRLRTQQAAHDKCWYEEDMPRGISEVIASLRVITPTKTGKRRMARGRAEAGIGVVVIFRRGVILGTKIIEKQRSE
jgi:hypothetical protein